MYVAYVTTSQLIALYVEATPEDSKEPTCNHRQMQRQDIIRIETHATIMQDS